MNVLAIYLKVKQQSLALEAKYIKHLMNKHRPKTSQDDEYVHFKLRNHLKSIVSLENRATNIARAYLRGKPYYFVEPKIKKEKFCKCLKSFGDNKEYNIMFFDPYTNYVFKRVSDIVAKYESIVSYNVLQKRRSSNVVLDEIIAWRDKHPQLLGE